MHIYGQQNVPKDKFLIVASNHLSSIDPFLIVDAVNRPVAYMAKQELFEKPIGRFFMDWLGAFAVNREKLGVSTIKTALAIKQTNWLLGIFPQGTREREDNMDNVARGFVGIAKILKCDILPVGLIGTAKDDRLNHKKDVVINIGRPIKYNEDSEKMSKLWVEQIEHLTQNVPKQKSDINYSKKEAKDLNILTRLYQYYGLYLVFPLITMWFYKIKYMGRKNIDKKKLYIVAPNHISYFDPFLTAIATGRRSSFMAKKELFEGEMEHWGRKIYNLGSFAVNREKPEISTIKSAKEVFKTNFDLCIFPQGGIRKNKKLEEINEGFIYFAKLAKRDILPVAITGTEETNWKFFNRKKVSVIIGKPISYELEQSEIVKLWKEEIASLNGYEIA